MTTTRQKIAVLAVACLALLGAIGVAAPANAETSAVRLSATDEGQIRSFFTKFDVDSATQDQLVADFKAGIQWQSLTSTSVPATTSHKVSEGVDWNVETFADGSVRATGIGDSGANTPLSDRNGALSPRGVNDCGYSDGVAGNYYNCNIYYWVGVVTSNFKANFTINGSGYDSITSVWGSTFTAIGSCASSIPAPTIVKGSESSTGPAAAGFTATAQMCGYPYGTSFPSYLYVGGNRAWHEFS